MFYAERFFHKNQQEKGCKKSPAPPIVHQLGLLDGIAHGVRLGVICYEMVRIAFCIILIGCASFLVAAPAPHIDFDRDIRPILSERCYECHGTDKAKGGLRLNDSKIAQSELKSGNRAIVAGNAGKSELLRRVTSTDPDEYMPPKGEPLTKIQIDKLHRWISEGAKWEIHLGVSPHHSPNAAAAQKRSLGEK